MAIGDVFRLHCLWRSSTSLLTMENGFSFRQDSALILDTPGEDLVQAFSDVIFDVYRECLHSNYEFQGYRVEALPSNLTVHEAAGGGQGGQLTGDMMPPFVAGILSIRTATPGPRGRGRVYLGPVNEASNASNGTVGFSYVSLMNNLRDVLLALDANILYAGWSWGVWSESDQEFREATTAIGRTTWGKQSGRSK